VSVPARGLLLVADAALGDLGVPPDEVGRLLSRNLAEVRPPALTEAMARGLCEAGARAAAEVGLIEEEDLAFFGPAPDADADALVRRAISAGVREWDVPGEVHAYGVGEIPDADGAESLGLGPGAFVLVVSVGAGDLGRLAFSGHRERILSRVRHGGFGSEEDLPAAPAGREEASDLLAAAGAAANFADARAALLAYALRRALGEVAGPLSLRAAWRVGGVEESGGSLVHRRDLAAAAAGEALASGGGVVAGTGKMCGSVPPFAAPEVDGLHPWEEAGLLERWADLHPPERKS
jgi:tRNA-splicing ligase RtcB